MIGELEPMLPFECGQYELTEFFPNVRTVCAFHGQLFVGGFIPDADGYVSFGETPLLELPCAETFDACYPRGPGLGFVGWSHIGSVQFGMNENNTPDRMNTSGFAPLEAGGEVLRVLPLGKGVMAYGTKSVEYFFPVVEPAPTYGRKRLAIVPGCASRSAVGGDHHLHVLVDASGQLWRITEKLEPELLGFQEYFESMLGTEIVVTYNPADVSFTIANEEQAYLLSDGGLTRYYQAVTSQYIINNVPVGVFEEVDDQGFDFKTDTIDLGFRGLKTLTSIEVGMSHQREVYASVDWRSNARDPFRPTRWVRLNRQGIATLMVTAAEFRIKLQAASFNNVEIDYILVKYKLSDRRNVRGPGYANTTDE